MQKSEDMMLSDIFRDDLDSRPVMVSVNCCTYNQEAFIRDALEGFVMQQTDFRFEVIVHDDASTDGTAKIIAEYAEKYPSIIKPIYEKENLYSRHDGSLSRVMNAHMRGKYIAFCEGDDYWTDPLKLQKQVDFLEANPDYSMCFHNAIEIWMDGSQPQKIFSDISNRDYSGIEIYENWIVPTASVIYRNMSAISDKMKEIWESKKFIVGDLPLFLSSELYGKVRGFDDCMSVYRRHKDGITMRQGHNKFMKFIEQCVAIPKYFGPKYKTIVKHTVSEKLFAKALGALKERQIKHATIYFTKSISIAPYATIKLYLKRFSKSLS